jgi:enoyl-CoA hydratase
MSNILYERGEDGVVILTFNRPEFLNAFTFPMYEEFLAYLEDLRLDAAARVVVLRGAGRAFSAGHDLRGGPPPSWSDASLGNAYAMRRNLAMIGRIPQLIRQLPQPVIAAVNGPAAGAGFVFALAADLCLAARSAKFVNGMHNAGTGHELGISWMLPRAIGTQRAAEILLTSRPIHADEAAAIGLALQVVDDDLLMSVTLELAARVTSNAPMAVTLTKQSLWVNQGVGNLEAACEIEARAVILAGQTEDALEKRRAYIDKRAPVFTNK